MRTKVLTLVVPLLLAGCSTGGGRDDGPVTLRFQSLAWQAESVTANKELVKQWNATHGDVKVEYVQGSWGSVHDQLLTAFEGGEAPDVIHDASDDLADFAYGGRLADLTSLLPARLKSDIPERSWETTTFGDGVYGVPFLQEPRVLVANATWLKRSRVRIPTPEHPWSWPEFRQQSPAASAASGEHGVRGGLAPEGARPRHPQPVPVGRRAALPPGRGRRRHRPLRSRRRGRPAHRPRPDRRRSQRVAHHARQRRLGHTAGFFGGRYAMVPLGFSYRQQIAQQAPKGFRWQVLPAPAGADGPTQGVSPQTLSVAEDSRHKKEAVEFIDFLLRPKNTVRLALGDWMLPTGTQALSDPALHGAKDGWATGTALAAHLRPAPAQSVRGYPSGRTRWPPPPSRSTTAARSASTDCASAWRRTATWYWPVISAEAGRRRLRGGPRGPGGSAARGGCSSDAPPRGSRRARPRGRRPAPADGPDRVEPVVARQPPVRFEGRAGRARPRAGTIATATAWLRVTIGLGASCFEHLVQRDDLRPVGLLGRRPRRVPRRSPPAPGTGRVGRRSASVISAIPSSMAVRSQQRRSCSASGTSAPSGLVRAGRRASVSSIRASSPGPHPHLRRRREAAGVPRVSRIASAVSSARCRSGPEEAV